MEKKELFCRKKLLFKTIKNILIIFLFTFVIPLLLFCSFNKLLQIPTTFDKGFKLCGIDVSGLTSQQARDKIFACTCENLEDLHLTLRYKERIWKFSSEDFEIKSKIHLILEELDKTSHKNAFWNRSKVLKQIKKMGFDDKIATNYVLRGMDEILNNIAQEICVEPVSATALYNFNKKDFDIVPEKLGIKMDKTSLYNEIVYNLENHQNIIIDIKTIPIHPQFSTLDIQKATKKQGEFSTTYTYSNLSRKNNISLAVKALNNAEILPGETFSFNRVIGKRTLDKGYKEANIIKDGVFVKGLGGGICQVSSTLFNALLLSNLEVTEAHKHTLPVSYVQPALDAMVSWGSADLKFTNTTSLPIYIVGSANGNKINFKIFGDTNPQNYQIKTRGEIIKIIESNRNEIVPDINGKFADKILFKGEYVCVKKPKNGYEAKSFVDYYKNGELVNSKQIRHATYEPQKGILYEGCDKLPEGMTLPSNNIYNL